MAVAEDSEYRAERHQPQCQPQSLPQYHHHGDDGHERMALLEAEDQGLDVAGHQQIRPLAAHIRSVKSVLSFLALLTLPSGNYSANHTTASPPCKRLGSVSKIDLYLPVTGPMLVH